MLNFKKILYLKSLVFVLFLMNCGSNPYTFSVHDDACGRAYEDAEFGDPCPGDDVTEGYDTPFDDSGKDDIIDEALADIPIQTDAVATAAELVDLDDKTMTPEMSAATTGDQEDFSSFLDQNEEEEKDSAFRNLSTSTDNTGDSGGGGSGSGSSNELSMSDVSTEGDGSGSGGNTESDDDLSSLSEAGKNKASSYAATSGARGSRSSKFKSSNKTVYAESSSSENQDFNDGNNNKLTAGKRARIDADPKNYFDLISIEESIFKIVERRYKNKNLKWSVEKAQELLKKI